MLFRKLNGYMDVKPILYINYKLYVSNSWIYFKEKKTYG